MPAPPINFINGGVGNDRLFDTSNTDAIVGNDGNDTVVASSIPEVNFVTLDTFEGGAGTDTLDYSGFLSGIFANLNGNVVARVNAWGQVVSGDEVHGFENMIGTDFFDSLIGNSANNRFDGGGAGDDLFGASGNDTLLGRDGDDELDGGSGRDLLVGGAGEDVITTGTGRDVVRWEAGDYGADTIMDFDLGQDLLSFGGGFLDIDPTERADYADLLLTFQAVNDTLLYAETSDGMQLIARFENVDRTAFQAAIDDGSLFSIKRGGVGGDGPGGVVSPTRGDQFDRPGGDFDLFG